MEILRVPKLNENMEAAMVGPWSKALGDDVREGEVVVELITEKASFGLEAGEAGVLRDVAASEKSTVPVGYALAVIAGPNEEIPDVEAENETLMESYASALQADVTSAPRSTGRATPAARRLARQKGIDLAEMSAAHGIDGVIDKAAVRRYIEGME